MPEQKELGDVVYVELPKVGAHFKKGETFGSVESVKAASDVYLPVSGTVVEVNDALREKPELINADSQKDGWICKITTDDEPNDEKLMQEEAYLKFVA